MLYITSSNVDIIHFDSSNDITINPVMSNWPNTRLVAGDAFANEVHHGIVKVNQGGGEGQVITCYSVS